MSKGVIFSLFTFIITFIAIYLNWSEFSMGNYATALNFAASTFFILLWFLFSFYLGIKREKIYVKYVLVYWGINIISFVLIWIIIQSNFSGLFLLPFSIWYGSPVYGFRYLLRLDNSRLILATAPLGLIISVTGYGVGLIVSKKNKS